MEMKARARGMHENGKIERIVGVRGLDDDRCAAWRIVMQLDRPARPELGDQGGKVPALPRPQRCRAAGGRSARAPAGGHVQHDPIPPLPTDGRCRCCMVPTPWTCRPHWWYV